MNKFTKQRNQLFSIIRQNPSRLSNCAQLYLDPPLLGPDADLKIGAVADIHLAKCCV